MRSRAVALALLFLLISLVSQPKSTRPAVRDEPTDSSTHTADPEPLPLASEDSSNNPTPTEENLSLDELKKQRDQAIIEAKNQNATVQTLKGDLEKKRTEAVEPTRIFNEKNATFMKLDAIARGKEAEFNEKKDAADTARKAFLKAESALKSADGKFETADKAVRDHPDNIQKARDEVARIKNAPADRITVTAQKTAKENGKPDLINRVGLLNTEARKANNTLIQAKKTLDAAQSRFDGDQCSLPAKKVSQNCKNKQTTLNTATTAYNNANTANDTAFETLKLPKEELDNFYAVLKSLTKKIDELTEIENNLDAYVGIAESKLNKLIGQTDTLTQQLSKAGEAKRLAKEEFGKKESAKNDAESKEIAPDESEAARSLATTALLEMNDQGAVKDPIDKQVKEIEDKLEAAQKSYDQAKSQADLAEKRYDTAMRKDAEARKGLSGATIGVTAGSLIAALIILAILLFCCWKRDWCCCVGLKGWLKGKKLIADRSKKTQIGLNSTKKETESSNHSNQNKSKGEQ